MTDLYFATGNENKLKEAATILEFPLKSLDLKIDEIQSLDPQAVAIAKAKAYFDQVKQPLFIEDLSLTFTHLNTLPGTFIDYFHKSIGNQGLIDLLINASDRSAIAQTTLCYIAPHQEPKVFTGEIKGTISSQIMGDSNFGWDPIFIPKGYNKTFAQMSPEEKNSISMRRLALDKLKTYLLEQS